MGSKEQENSTKTRATVDIFGNRYTIVGHSSVVHMQKVAKHVHDQMRRIADASPRLDISRIAVLTAVNATDDYLKQRDQQTDKQPDQQDGALKEQHITELEQSHKALQEQMQTTLDQYNELQEEYAKLQNEFNEWIELVGPQE